MTKYISDQDTYERFVGSITATEFIKGYEEFDDPIDEAIKEVLSVHDPEVVEDWMAESIWRYVESELEDEYGELRPLVIELINELDRLQCSTLHDPYSGLMVDCRIANLVKVYDDHTSGLYLAPELLAHLKTLSCEDVSLTGDDNNNIWNEIHEFIWQG